MKKIFVYLFVAIMLLSLVGCAKTTPITTPSTSTLEPQNLADVTWILTSYGDATNMTAVLPNWKDITLIFNGSLNGYSGSDGVNDYGGACHVQNDYSVAMSVITSTQIGYSDNPRGIIKQIQTYYDLLHKANSYNISNTVLMINCSNGQALKFFGVYPPLFK